jgi:hypothetical protein
MRFSVLGLAAGLLLVASQALVACTLPEATQLADRAAEAVDGVNYGTGGEARAYANGHDTSSTGLTTYRFAVDVTQSGVLGGSHYAVAVDGAESGRCTARSVVLEATLE